MEHGAAGARASITARSGFATAQAVRLAAAAAAAIYTFALDFPMPPLPIAAGPDASWIFGINRAHASGLSFGSDILYTLGPLGFLLAYQDIEHNLREAQLFGIGLAALTAVLAARGVARASSWPRAAVFVLALAVALNTVAWSEQRILVPILVALAAQLDEEHTDPWSLTAIVLAAASLSMKISLAAAAGATLGAFVVLQLARRRTTWQRAATLLALYGVAAVLLFVASGSRIEDLLPYISAAMATAAGYGDSLGKAGPPSEVAWAAAGFAVLGIGALAVGRPLRDRVLLAAPTLLLAYKHSFIRQDLPHVLDLAVTFAAVAAVLAAAARTTRDTALSALCLTIGVGGVVLAVTNRDLGMPRLVRLLDPQPGFERISSLLSGAPPRRRVGRRALMRDLAPLTLPAEVRALIGDATVDVVPHETARIAANALQWRPRPLFQSFAVETSTIDDRNAAHVASPRAAEFVLYGFDALERFHPFFQEPASLRAMLCRYAPVAVTSDLVVLRRGEPRCGELETIARRAVRFGEDVPLPESQSGLHLRLKPRHTLLGGLTSALLRPPPVWIAVRYADGSEATYRFSPHLSDNGLWIGNLPRDLNDVLALLHGEAPTLVSSFRLEAPDGGFEPTVEVELARLDLRVAGAAAAESRTEDPAALEHVD